MNRPSPVHLAIFTILALVSLTGAAYAVLVYVHTPMLIHDTMYVIGQELTDPQRDALYLALLKAYRPIIFGGAAVVIGWTALVAVVLRGKLRLRPLQANQDAVP